MEIEKKQPKKCGIYCFEAISGNLDRIGWKYIGRTKNDFISNRKTPHLRSLRKNKHHSHKLQRYYNKYGENSLKFYILHECLESELCFYEKFWIKCFDSYKNGFNETEGGENVFDNTKLYTFKNAVTGEIIENITCKEFSEKYNMKFNCARVIAHGGVKHIRDWYCPENGEWKPKEKKFCKVISPDGTKYDVEYYQIKQFCTKMGINPVPFYHLLRKNTDISQGWTRPDSKIRTPETDPCAGEYKFVSPDGKLVCGKNITQFCKDNNLNRFCISFVMKGEQKQHKGWRLYKEGVILKKFNKNDFKPKLPESKIEYSFVSPEGKVFKIKSNKLAVFADEHNLDDSTLFYVWKEKYKQHKGWTKNKE